MVASDQIIQVLDHLCETCGLAIDWTSENVVPYLTSLCTKLVAYEIWESVAWIVFSILMTIAMTLAVKKLFPVFKNGVEEQESFEIGWTVGSIFAVIGLVIFYSIMIGEIMDQTMDIIQCVTFPEMFIFEYIQGLINTAS